MENSKTEGKIKKLKSLPQYKNFTEEQLRKVVMDKEAKEEVLDLLSLEDEKEREYAQKLLDIYLSEYQIEAFSDRDNLNHLIYLQISVDRIKKQLNKISKDTPDFIPQRALEQLQELNSQIIDFKKLLGMNKSEQDKQYADVSSVIENLKTRFHRWINEPEHKANYQIKCGKCGHLFLIRRRLDKDKDEILTDHPWFIEGGILFNLELFKCYKEGKVSKDNMVKILACSPDYIDWLEKKFSAQLEKENG